MARGRTMRSTELSEAGRSRLPGAARRLLAGALLPLLLALSPGPAAWAHPHVFIDVQAKLLFDKGDIAGVDVEWTFDELFSAMLIRDFDADRDGRMSPEESAKLRVGAFDNLKDLGWFTHFRLNGKMALAVAAEGFRASIVKGRLVYNFTARPAAPANPRTVSWNVLFFDDSYYVDLRLTKDQPVSVAGKAAPRCAPEVDRNPKIADFAGMFVPEMIHVRCS